MGITTADLQEIEAQQRGIPIVPVQLNSDNNSTNIKTNGKETVNKQPSLNDISKMSKKQKHELLQRIKNEKQDSLRLQAELDEKIKAITLDFDEQNVATGISKALPNSKARMNTISSEPSIADASKRTSENKRRGSSNKQSSVGALSSDENEEADFKALMRAAEETVKNTKQLSRNSNSSSQQHFVDPADVNIQLNGNSNNKLSFSGAVVPTPPPMCCGFMSKQGQVFRSWKTRFFVLKEGVLTYYTGETEPGSQVGDMQVGSPLVLKGYCVTQPEPGQLFLTIPGRKSTIADNMGTRGRTQSTANDADLVRSLLVQVKTKSDLERWEHAFDEHITYITRL